MLRRVKLKIDETRGTIVHVEKLIDGTERWKVALDSGAGSIEANSDYFIELSTLFQGAANDLKLQ